jgi:hypothetical protein
VELQAPPPLPSTKIITSCRLLAIIYSICIIVELLFVAFHDNIEEEERRYSSTLS